MFDFYYRSLLRRVLSFLAKRKMIHQLDADIQEFWEAERGAIERERAQPGPLL